MGQFLVNYYRGEGGDGIPEAPRTRLFENRVKF